MIKKAMIHMGLYKTVLVFTTQDIINLSLFALVAITLAPIKKDRKNGVFGKEYGRGRHRNAQ